MVVTDLILGTVGANITLGFAVKRWVWVKVVALGLAGDEGLAPPTKLTAATEEGTLTSPAERCRIPASRVSASFT